MSFAWGIQEQGALHSHAALTSMPKGAASKARRSLAGEALEVGFEKTPCLWGDPRGGTQR